MVNKLICKVDFLLDEIGNFKTLCIFWAKNKNDITKVFMNYWYRFRPFFISTLAACIHHKTRVLMMMIMSLWFPMAFQMKILFLAFGICALEVNINRFSRSSKKYSPTDIGSNTPIELYDKITFRPNTSNLHLWRRWSQISSCKKAYTKLETFKPKKLNYFARVENKQI